MYGYQAVGTAYRLLQDPEFDRDRALASGWLRRGIKGVAMGWHVLASLAVYVVVRGLTGPTRAGLAATLVGSPDREALVEALALDEVAGAGEMARRTPMVHVHLQPGERGLARHGEAHETVARKVRGGDGAAHLGLGPARRGRRRQAKREQ